MALYDWSSFVLKVPVNAPVKDLYTRWCIPLQLETWFLRQARFTKSDGSERDRTDAIQAGDRYTWLWHGYPDGSTEKGEVLMANGENMLSFTFGKAGSVSVLLYTEEKTTICELRQYHIPVDETSKTNFHTGCMTGWTFYLANLKSVVEGGIDLRNKNIHLKGVINS